MAGTRQAHSDFELSIRPDALGVMLRRRLDLQYPNQKAIVYVADATTDKPEWQEAGTWYTAGGNTVVFGDPRVIPEAKRKQHVELAPPAHVVQTSNRRWRDDEFLLPPRLTRGREKIRVRCEFVPVKEPLFPGHPLAGGSMDRIPLLGVLLRDCRASPANESGENTNHTLIFFDRISED